MRNTGSKLRLLGAFGASAVMLTLAQAPISIWPLAWVGYVPFILASSPKRFTAETAETKKGSDPFFYLIAYIVGAIFWLGNIYWMGFPTVAGWILFCLYTALFWPILAVSIRWCINKKIPLVIAVPVLVVGIEQSQGLFLGGFYWFYLGHSQYANTTLIQIADIFGSSGVSFLVGMVSGAIAEMFIVHRSLFIVRNLIVVSVAIAGTLIYGHWRINQAEKFVTAGPEIAAVQTNVPQSVKQSFEAEEQIFDELLGQTNQCIPAGAKLVVWPETMVQAILEPQVLGLLDDSHQYKKFDKVIKDEAKSGSTLRLNPVQASSPSRGGVYLLVGAYGGSPRIEENFDIRMAEKYNAAFLYKPDGNEASEKYYKIHLVPFGEYLPFKNVALIHKFLLKMSPYDFDYTLDAGKEYTAFEMTPAGASRPYRFGVLICYEDAVPTMARRFALDENGRKRIDWLVNISNDGWFVRFVSTKLSGVEKNKVMASTELAQHTVICAFRAVENRLAVLRSVNTGISCMIDTLGRIRDGFKAGNLPKNAFDRQGVGGWFADTVPIDARITIFSRYGQWLDFSCQICLAGIIMFQIIERFVLKKKKNKNEAVKQ